MDLPFIDSHPLAGVFISALISSTLLPGGSEALLAWHTSQASAPISWLVAAATMGNVLGALITFAMGVLIAKYYPLKQLDKKYQRKALTYLQRFGPFALLLSWLPIIGDPLCLAAGWLRLPFWLSALMISVGKALRYLFVAGLFA